MEVQPDQRGRPLGSLEQRQQRVRQRLVGEGTDLEGAHRGLGRGLQELASQRLVGGVGDRVQHAVHGVPPRTELLAQRVELLGLGDVEPQHLDRPGQLGGRLLGERACAIRRGQDHLRPLLLGLPRGVEGDAVGRRHAGDQEPMAL